MTEKKVSIITPCFNSEKTIRKTIESVLSQTYSNIEYIIIDGGSKDGTMSIVKEYEPLFDGRMQYVSEKDTGVYDAMNKGIKKAKGELIGIINSDDFYEFDAVELAVDRSDSYPYMVIYGYCNYRYKNGYQVTMKNSHENLEKEMIPHPTCFVTRETYRRYGLFSKKYKIASDYELMLRFYKNDKIKFVHIPQVIATFVEGGLSSGTEIEKEKMKIQKLYGIQSSRKVVPYLLENKIEQHCENYQKQNRELKKHRVLFMTAIRWIQLQQERKSIADALLQKGYDEIAIYGMSMLGERLIDELASGSVEVKYYIDRERNDIYHGVGPKMMNENLPNVDAIVVTAITAFDTIERQLRSRISTPILSLEEIMDEM